MVGELGDPRLDAIERYAVARQHQHVIGQGVREALQRAQIGAERILIGFVRQTLTLGEILLST